MVHVEAAEQVPHPGVGPAQAAGDLQFPPPAPRNYPQSASASASSGLALALQLTRRWSRGALPRDDHGSVSESWAALTVLAPGAYSPLVIREDRMAKTDLLQGTLDLLVLKILAQGPNHGWGISNRIRQMSKEGLTASQGSLYPSLHRLELGGYVVSEMTPSENNRKARVYKLTAAGRRHLEAETENWEQFVVSMKRILQGA